MTPFIVASTNGHNAVNISRCTASGKTNASQNYLVTSLSMLTAKQHEYRHTAVEKPHYGTAPHEDRAYLRRSWCHHWRGGTYDAHAAASNAGSRALVT